MQNLWTVIVLALLIVVSGAVAGSTGISWLPQAWLVGLGLLILIAYAGGQALRSIGLPALLGWIGAGILMGPNFAQILPVEFPLALISEEMIERLDLVQVLIIAVIGMLGGAKFRLSDLAGNIRLPLKISGAFLLIVVPLTMAAVLLAGQLFPDSLVFLAEQPASVQVTIALIFGVLAFGLAPTVTVAMLQELRARGPLSTVVLGVVFLTEFILFVLFAVVIELGQAVVGPEELSAAVILAALPSLFGSLALSILIGAALGILTALYLRFVGREPLLFVLTLLIVGYFGVVALGAVPLLTFLVAGFLVQNNTEQGDVLNHALERIALPVFVVYFVIAAAGIDLAGVLTYLPLVAILVLTRISALYWAGRWATTAAVQNSHVYEYLRVSFFSQAAVVLVLAGLVADVFAWGPAVQSVVIATVVVYLLVGPVLLKLGLDRSGETRRARRALLGGEEALDARELKAERVRELPEVMDLDEALAAPSFPDAWLRGHVDDLREALVTQGRQTFYEPVRGQFRQLHDVLTDVSEVVDEQSDGLQGLVEEIRSGADHERLARMARELQTKYSRQMIPVVRRIQGISGVAVGGSDIWDFFEHLGQVEDQESLYRIEREPSLDEPTGDDPLWLRSLKVTQRLRTKMVGRRYRTVPVGKLWRYHVELALPVRLARRVPEVVVYNERFWKRFWRHLQRLDDFWDSLIADITRTIEEVKAEADPNISVIEEAPEQRRARRTKRRVDSFYKEFRQEQRELDSMAEQSARLLQYRFSQVVARSYGAFVDAVARAGTIYLPRFRYRPSARFNQGRRAEFRVVDRLKRQETVVAGYRGWIRLDHELSALEQWTQLFRRHTQETLERCLGGQWDREFVAFSEDCIAPIDVDDPADGDASWEEIYRNKLRPRLAELRQEQEELLIGLQSGEATSELSAELDERLSSLPEAISVLAATPEDVAIAATTEHFELPLRQWMSTQVGRETALRIVEFNDRAAERVEQRLALLSSVEQVLEFNLVTARKEEFESGDEPSPEAMAREGLERARQLIESFVDDARPEGDELQRWLDEEVEALVADAIEPIEERRLGEVRRRLARSTGTSYAARRESWITGVLEPVSRAAETVRTKIGAQGAGWIGEIRHLLVEESEEFDQFESQHLLRTGEAAAQTEAPPIYRRLFAPTPLDIPEFYQPRQRQEERFLETVGEFFSGGEQAILISAGPGVGKRTFVRQLVPGRVYALEGRLSDERVARVDLLTVARDEEAICAEIGRAILGRRSGRTFEKISQRIQRRRVEPMVVVVEHAERLVLRTEEGLQRCRRFMQMVEETADKVLWIVSMGDAGADYLRTHLDLESYFTHHQVLPEMSVDQIESMIMARHQASGFSLEFQAPTLSPLERLKQPLFGPEARRLSRRIFFQRLAELAGNNPRAALLHWLGCVTVDPVDPSRMLVEPLEPPAISLLAPLSLEHRLVLAQFSIHESLSAQDLAEIFDRSTDEVERDIRYLTRLGFLERVANMKGDHRLRSVATVWVQRELRRLNLI